MTDLIAYIYAIIDLESKLPNRAIFRDLTSDLKQININGHIIRDLLSFVIPFHKYTMISNDLKSNIRRI